MKAPRKRNKINPFDMFENIKKYKKCKKSSFTGSQNIEKYKKDKKSKSKEPLNGCRLAIPLATLINPVFGQKNVYILKNKHW